MNVSLPPRFDGRRRAELLAEMSRRAASWMTDWTPGTGSGDFGNALLSVAARVLSEVTQRLDQVPLKTFRGFLSWLGARGRAATAARVPIAFALAPKSDAVTAIRGVQLQASGDAGPIVLETETDLTIVPGTILALAAADPASNQFFLAPPGLTTLGPPPAPPNEWHWTGPVVADGSQNEIQLDSPQGLERGLVLVDQASGLSYTVTSVAQDIVTISPPFGTGGDAAASGTITFERADSFTPFPPEGGIVTARNAQENALYLGSTALDLPRDAVIEVVSDGQPLTGLIWSYSTQDPTTNLPSWVQLPAPIANLGSLYLKKPAGAVGEITVGGKKSHWLKATRAVGGSDRSWQSSSFGLRINCSTGTNVPAAVVAAIQNLTDAPAEPIQIEGIASTTPLVLNAPFYPFGQEPRLFDAFYIGCQEGFSKRSAHIALDFKMARIFSAPLSSTEVSGQAFLAAGVAFDRRLHFAMKQFVVEQSPNLKLGVTQPKQTSGTPVDLTPGAPLGAATLNGTAYLIAAAGTEIWRWTVAGADVAKAENPTTWDSLGTIQASNQLTPGRSVQTVLVAAEGQLTAYALVNGAIHARNALFDDSWRGIAAVGAKEVRRIIRVTGSSGGMPRRAILAYIDSRGRLYVGNAARGWTAQALPQPLDSTVVPLVVEGGSADTYVVFAVVAASADSHAGDLIAYDTQTAPSEAKYRTVQLRGKGLALAPREGTRPAAVLTADVNNTIAHPVIWDPFQTDTLVFAENRVGAEALVDAPVALDNAYFGFPTVSGDLEVVQIQLGAAPAPAKVADWLHVGMDVAVNPTLSWEYWNGSSWWQLHPLLAEETNNLTRSGTVQFCLPDDLQQTDVAGRKNHWIRARLVDGDYGRTQYTTVSTTDPDTKTITTVSVPDTSSIQAPEINSLGLSYQVCCTVTPDYVITGDSGNFRDQTSANASANAGVEYFVPVAQMLTVFGASDGRAALYVAFDTAISGDAINLLFDVADNELEGAYPLQVEVLSNGAFTKVQSQDDTYGLSERGILSFELLQKPQRAVFFGTDAPCWIRISPNPTFPPGSWTPTIRGVYLNAVWARAAATQKNERLGSSDGSPEQQFRLALVPILDESLSLRVLEPLEDEEVERIRTERGANAVLTSLNLWPGPWVLWKEVPDTADYGPTDRVYSLNETDGTITFGDGQNGMIPPIGTGSIVAESYQHGGGAGGNAITQWSELNLTTPLQGVQTTVALDDAAGGADQQDPETALRFAPAKLMARGRLITLRDFENAALQFNPYVAQARASAGPNGLTVVFAMKGSQVEPSAAQRRALSQSLQAAAAPQFSRQGYLTVRGPRVVNLRVSLTLSTADLGRTAGLGQQVRTRIQALFDPASGALDGSGWPFGRMVDPTEIAAAIVSISDIDSIDTIVFQVVNADGTVRSLPGKLAADQLLQVAPEDVIVNVVITAEGPAA